MGMVVIKSRAATHAVRPSRQITTGALCFLCLRITSRTADLRASSIWRPSAKIRPTRLPCLAFILSLRPDTFPESGIIDRSRLSSSPRSD